jgi:nucleoside-diphosphate-sugar epimerase
VSSALVTGANGFIGSNLVRLLLEKSWSVRSLVLRGTPLDVLEGLSTQILFGDILEPSTLETAARGVDVVFHLAALARDWGPPGPFLKVNVGGTRNVVEAAAAGGARRIVLVSSLAVHEYRGHRGAGEDAPLDCPADFHYGQSKIASEAILREAHEKGRVEGVVVRPGVFPFGPNDTTSFAKLAPALEKGFFAFVNGGEARLSTAYVENLCHGLLLAASSDRAAGKTYVIADDVEITWRELFALFCRELGVAAPRLSVPSPVAEAAAAAAEGMWTVFRPGKEPPLTRYRARVMARDLHFVSRKAKLELGYDPPVDLEEGIRRTVAWYRRYAKRA